MMSSSDCEVIIDLYRKIGIKKTVNALDGVFAFALYDHYQKVLYVARDPFGVRPLFYSKYRGFTFSSEMKGFPIDCIIKGTIQQFPAGHFGVFNNYDHFND